MNEETEVKKVKVSLEGQLTIPKVFYDVLRIDEEVTVEIIDGNLLIKPIHKLPEDFAEQLLESMIANGLSGEELQERFKEAKRNAGFTIFSKIPEQCFTKYIIFYFKMENEVIINTVSTQRLEEVKRLLLDRVNPASILLFGCYVCET